LTSVERNRARAKCRNTRRNMMRIRQAVRGGWGRDAQLRAIKDAHSGVFEKFIAECEEEAERALRNV
jgi:hypothetical protein